MKRITERARRVAAVSVLGLCWVVAAAVAAEGDPPAPSGASPAAPADAPAAPVYDTKSDYIIGPGDTIQVFVWRNPELSVSIPVRPDGKISTPLVEDLVAVGKTPSQLARDIEARLAEYIRSPQVNVIVTGAVSRFSQVTVIGQVGTPGSIPYREGMTVLDAVVAAGGLGEFAAGNRTKLVRKNESGESTETRIKLDDLLRKGRLKENRELRPGDVLIIPESLF